MTGHDDIARTLRADLDDPRALVERLDLAPGPRAILRQAGGVIIRCPWHEDRTPSCSIRRGRDGTISVRCFGCGETGDALTLVALANGLDVRRDFRAVLRIAAELAGRWDVVQSIDAGERTSAGRTHRHAPAPAPPTPLRALLDAFSDREPLSMDVAAWHFVGGVLLGALPATVPDVVRDERLRRVLEAAHGVASADDVVRLDRVASVMRQLGTYDACGGAAFLLALVEDWSEREERFAALAPLVARAVQEAVTLERDLAPPKEAA